MDTYRAESHSATDSRESPGDYYANRIFLTEGGGIGMDVGGHCIVKAYQGLARAGGFYCGPLAHAVGYTSVRIVRTFYA